MEPAVDEVAAALRESIGLLLRRVRQAHVAGELTLPESSALARIERGGPATSADLAKLEQISPQSMGATLAGLELRGLIAREPDPQDGRRMLVSITATGRAARQLRRSARNEQFARALSSGFSRAEVKQLAAAAPLLERLAQSF